jgi:hypothetical protein
MALRINAGAACEEHSCSGKSIEEITRSIQVNLPINVCVAAARAHAMDYSIKSINRYSACRDPSRVRDIDRKNGIWFGR